MLDVFNFNKAFLGAWGISLREGLTDTHLVEVELKQSAIARAQEVVAVVDGTKFGRLGLASFARIEQLSSVVTDEDAPAEVVADLGARGVRVLIASLEWRID